MEKIYNKWQLQDKDLGNNERYQFTKSEVLDFAKYYSKQLKLCGVMPRNLTAENGAKALLIGEFVECFDPDESGNAYIVPISWDSIKDIYKRIVDHYVA